MKEIEAKALDNISEKELRVLELKENIRRKDLTELEKSKNLVELAEIKEQELREQRTRKNCRESVHSNNQAFAAETAKNLGGRPQKVTSLEKILDFVSRKLQLPSVHKEEDFCSYMEECGKVTKKYHKALYSFLDINADEKDFKMLSAVVTPQTAGTYIYEAEDALSKLAKVRNLMKGVIENGKNQKLEPKAREMIYQKMRDSGEMNTDEIMDLIRPHYLFDKGVAKEQGIRRSTHQMMAQIRDEKGIGTVFACKVGGIHKYVNIDESRNVKALRSVEGQLTEKCNGLEISCAKASRNRMEAEGQMSLDLAKMM